MARFGAPRIIPELPKRRKGQDFCQNGTRAVALDSATYLQRSLCC